MALGKNRLSIFAHGLGTFEIRQVSPAASTSFVGVGYTKATVLDDQPAMVDIVPETGDLVNFLKSSEKAQLRTVLQQTSVNEINELKAAAGKIYAVRYYGRASEANAFQYFCLEQAMLAPKVQTTFQVGERGLPADFTILKQDELAYDVPLFYIFQAGDVMFMDKLQLFLDPLSGLNVGTSKLLDESGFARHGDLTSAINTMWNAGGFLRFDGANDAVSFGDILDDDAVSDFVIEGWVRVQAADGTLQEIFCKKAGLGNSAGFGIYRSTANKIVFSIAGGASEAQVVTTNTVLQNVWKHVYLSVSRAGTGQLYLNGVADGAAVSVAAIPTAANALALKLGADNSGFGQIDAGAWRIFVYGAAALPGNAATIAARHFSAEHAKYGV